MKRTNLQRCLPLLSLITIIMGGGLGLAATTLSVSTSNATPSSVDVSWSQSGDYCFTQYHLEYRETGSGAWIEENTYTSASQTSATINGLSPDTAYEVRVVDEDCFGTQASAPSPIRTQSLAAVGALAVGFIVILILIVVGVIVAIVALVRFLHKGSPAPPVAPMPPPMTPPPWQSQYPVQPPPMQPPPMQPPAAQAYQPQAAPAPPAAPTSSFCSQCGSPLTGPFCGKCGNKNW